MSSHTSKISLGAMLTLVLSCQGSSQTYGWEKKVAVAGLGNPLTYNPVNSNTLYGASFVGNDGSVVVSYDRGVTWQLYSVVAGG
ncbi:MAG TPA: hypothetical protein VGR15_07895, partial [Bacteroidota bacterium]|nr:hypothetical protein [Bacteroidota bacterium]